MSERTHILNLLAEGKISADQGAQLLSALPSTPTSPAALDKPTTPRSANGRTPHWFHVRVSDLSTGRHRVNIAIPLALVKVGLKIGARFAPEIAGLDPDEILQALQTATDGNNAPLIDVQDSEDGERVQIYVD